MNAYECKHCPLAFQVGAYCYWDLSGFCSQCVCGNCGTMHQIEHPKERPDVLFAQPGPIPAMVEVIHEDGDGQNFTSRELLVAADSWRKVRVLPTPVALQIVGIMPTRIAGVKLEKLACSYCGMVGRLVLEVGDDCPKCGGKLDLVYVDTIN